MSNVTTAITEVNKFTTKQKYINKWLKFYNILKLN